MDKLEAVIFDVDGTLAEKHPDRGYFDWKKVGLDYPHMDIVFLAQIIAEHTNMRNLIVSGRMYDCYKETHNWLLEHGVPYENLYMRPSGNFEPDEIIKKDIYRTQIEPFYEVKYVLDDRNKVVNMWRNELGLRVLQVADGNF